MTDLSPGMVKVAPRNGRAPGPGRRRPGRRRRGHPLRRRHLRPRRRARRAAPHPRSSSCRCARWCGCSSRAAGSCSRASRPGRRPLRPLLGDADLAGRHDGHQAARAGGWRRPQAELDESSRAAALEAIVDLHTFDPADLERMARSAGAVDVRDVTEEFTAAMLGWPVRTFEAAVPPGRLGWGWAKFAFRSWITLSWVDAQLLAPRGAEELVLQRHGDRGQAVARVHRLDDVAYLRPTRARRPAPTSTTFRLADRHWSDVAAARARFGDRAAVSGGDDAAAPQGRGQVRRPADWLFTDEAAAAGHRRTGGRPPRRAAGGRAVHDVTCSVGTELAALRDSAACGGSDVDPVRLAMAAPQRPGVDAVPRRRAGAGHPRRRRPRRPGAPQRRAAPLRPPRLHAPHSTRCWTSTAVATSS